MTHRIYWQSSMKKLAKSWKKLGAKFDELGSLDLEFEQKEAWSPEAGHWTGQLRWQNVDSILLLVWRVKERKH